jgi:DNA-binding transcriptional LysR family regulator
VSDIHKGCPMLTQSTDPRPALTNSVAGTRITLDIMLSGHEAAPPLLELGSNSAVKISVRAGVAPAVLSTLAVASAVRSGTLSEVPVDDLDLSRRLRAVWRAPRRLTSPASDLVNIARRAAAASN